MGLEGGERVLVIGGGEDHHRRIAQTAQMARRFETVHAWHAYIEQHQIRRETLDGFEASQAVVRLTHHLAGVKIADL